MCRVLGVSRSGLYAWRRRPRPAPRTLANARLTEQIREIHRDSRATYGSPRIHAELYFQGARVGRNRVARLMRANGIQAVVRRRFRHTTRSDHDFPVAANVLDRRFDVEAPDSVWATDITYISTMEGWLYLAVVLDLCSRRVVGWSMAKHMRTELVASALEMALGNRRPEDELLHHSDRGSQYASFVYQKILQQHGLACSMSRRAECYDNAVVESFFSSLKRELIYRSAWPTRDSARLAVHEYIEVFYNRRRRHSHLGYLTPAEYEARIHAAPAA